ncbi:MAG: response regulator [Anaerolineae bacterium]|nr:response regulator [Anaerolineae bacterium]
MEGRVLIIEDNKRNRNLLSRRFTEEGLDVHEALTGAEGITQAVRLIPPVVLLSTNLPDMPGIEVAGKLRAINRVKHVWLMMIGDKDNRKERLTGLDAGANDFITSPIDADLVALRVRNALNRQNQDNHTDPVTGMPAGRGVQEELLQRVRDREGDWALMRFRVQHLDPLRKVVGQSTGSTLLRHTAQILAEALSHDAIEDDFLGYGGRDDFIVITQQDRVPSLRAEVKENFEKVLREKYTAGDVDSGLITSEAQAFQLPGLKIQLVTPQEGPFYDIRSLTEALASS